MKVIDTLNKQHVIELHRLFLNEWWTNTRTEEETALCIKNSQICIALVDDNNTLQAFARVITDYVFKAFIFDVIVAKEYRKQGLGDKLIHLIKQHKTLNNVQCFELYCLPDLADFYQSHHFTTNVGDIKLMRYSPLKTD